MSNSFQKWESNHSKKDFDNIDYILKKWRFTLNVNGVTEFYHGTLSGLLGVCDKDTGKNLYNKKQVVKKEPLN